MGRLRRAPVFDAVCRGSMMEVESLLKSGKSPDATLPGCPTPLYQAVQLQHPDIAVALIKAGCSLQKQKCMWTVAPVLLMAAEFNMKEVVCELLQRPDCDPLLQDSKGNTIMHIAVKHENEELVKMLPRDRYVTRRDDYGQSPIHIAAEVGNLAILQILLDMDKTINDFNCKTRTDHISFVSYTQTSKKLYSLINLPTLGTKSTPLHFAAKNHHVDVIDFLLKNGAEVNAINIHHSTPLHSLCLGGVSTSHERCVRAVEKLLEAGADYTIPGLYNETTGSPRRCPPSLTPMIVAARRQCPALVEVLAERGADPMARDEEGRTALMVSLHCGDHQSAAYLLSHHPEGEQTHSLQDVHGCSCLHYVSSCRHHEGDLTSQLLEQGYCYLVRKGENPLQSNYSPLNSAVAAGKVSVAEVLLDHFPRLLLDLPGEYEAEYPLHAVAYLLEAHDHVTAQMTRLFLSHGADVDKELQGHTPLQMALRRGHWTLAELLLAVGCRVNFDLADVLGPFAEGPKLERLKGIVDGHRRVPPTLRHFCLTVVRHCVRLSKYGFKDMFQLPLPGSVVLQLRYLE